MILSPTKDSRSSRSNFKADNKPQAYYKEWMSLDCFQENMDTGNGFAKTKPDPKPDGSAGESVLQSSDLPNRQRAAPASNKGSFCGLSRCDSAEIEPVSSCPGSPGEPNFKKETGPADDVSRKKESGDFELRGVPDSNGNTGRSAQVGDNRSTRWEHHSKTEEEEEEEEAKDELYGEHEERVTDTVEKKTDKDVKSLSVHSTQDSSSPAPSLKEEIDNSEELNHEPEEMGNSEEQNHKMCSAIKDPDDNTNNNNRLDNRRKERIVPEEKLGTSYDFDNGEAHLPFSGALSLSGAVPYSGPIAFSGSISRRSDGSSTSTRSFAFPILPFEWNASPVRMPPPDRRWRRKRNWWCLRCCICCSQPSTHP